MPAAKYRFTWSDVAYLQADYMAGWGAFRGWSGEVDLEGEYVGRIDKCRGEHDPERDVFRVFYAAETSGKRDLVAGTIALDRTAPPCGGRVYFRAPCCGRRVRQLALLPEGLRCAPCGSITWDTRRKRKAQRLVHRAGKLAGKIELENWFDTPTKRPAGMHRRTFERLAERHGALVAEANAMLGPQLQAAAARGPDALLRAMLRAGL